MFNVVGEVIVDVILQSKMDSLMMRNVGDFTQSDRFMNSLTRRVDGCSSLIVPKNAHVKRHMGKTEERHRLLQCLQQKLLEIVHQPSLATLKVEAGVITSPTRTPVKVDWDGES